MESGVWQTPLSMPSGGASPRAVSSSPPRPQLERFGFAWAWGELCGELSQGSLELYETKRMRVLHAPFMPACLPTRSTRSHCRHANCHQPIRLSRIACANSHARLLGQPAVAAHPFQTRLARIACGGRGLAPTQRHSHRARAITDSNRRGPSLATSDAWAWVVSTSHPALLNCFCTKRARAIPYSQCPRSPVLASSSHSPRTSTACLPFSRCPPAVAASTKEELTLDTATHHHPKLPYQAPAP